MKITLIDGYVKHDPICSILDDKASVTVSNIMPIIEEWKNRPEIIKAYKVEPYNRITFFDDCVIVDFGDYSKFIKVDLDKDEMKEFKDNLNKAARHV